MITVTETAKVKIQQLLTEENRDDTYFLRVGVKGGGCSGLNYILEFDNTEANGDEIIDIDDVKIVCDKKSLLYLFGTELDYSDGLNGKGFHFNKPNAGRTCGCGQSFSV